MDKMRTVTTPYAGEDGKKPELHSYTAGKNGKWYNHSGKWFVSFL